MTSKFVQIVAVLSLLLSLGESNAPPFAGSIEGGAMGEMPDPGDVPALVAWDPIQLIPFWLGFWLKKLR